MTDTIRTTPSEAIQVVLNLLLLDKYIIEAATRTALV